MTRRLLTLTTILATTALGWSCAHGPAETAAGVPAKLSRKAAVTQVLRSSVRVQVSSGKTLRRAASGVVVDVVDSNGASTSYVVTNEHVVDAHDIPDVHYAVLVDGKHGTKTYEASVVAEGNVPGMDVAMLAVPGAKLEPAQLATDDELEIGDDVIVVGAPYGKGLSVSGGMLSQLEVGEGAPSMIKTDAPVGYGASGGGLFSAETGHLLGIIEGYRTAQVQIPGETEKAGWTFDVPMPGETFAAPMAKLRRFGVEHRVPGALGRAEIASRRDSPSQHGG